MDKAKILIGVGVALLLIAILGGAYYFWNKNRIDSVDSFQKCKDGGYPIQESYPERCSVPGGKTFTNPDQSIDTVKIGTIECLPHKDQDGPQTLECALGLNAEDGFHYAISDPQMNFISNAPTGTKVTITGKLTVEDSKTYDIAGKIEITDLKIN